MFFSEKPRPSIKPFNCIQIEPIIKDQRHIYGCNEFPKNVERYAKNLCGRIDTNSTNKKRLFFMNKPAVNIISKSYNNVKVAAVLSLKESVTLQCLEKNKLKVKYSVI